MKNLVLTGLPGSGKTALGKSAAEALGMAFADTDAMIVERAGQPIGEIFAESGEAVFRDMESAVVRRAAAMENTVISTGGGVVLRPENMRALRETGLVVFLDRDPEAIVRAVDCGERPLLAGGADRVYELSRQRRSLYLESAHLTCPNNGTPAEGLRSLLALARDRLATFGEE